MGALILHRLLHRKSFYIAILIGLFCSVAYFYTDELFLEESIEKDGGIAFTPYTKWMGIGGISDYPTLFLFLLPVIVSLPLADLFASDQRTGYTPFLFIRKKASLYFKALFGLNFAAAFITGTLPLIVNLYLSFMKLPNIPPDRVINNEMPLVTGYTFFPDFYYSHPLLHILFYILLTGLFSGVWASFALSISMLFHNMFIVVLSPFVLQFILNTVFTTLGQDQMQASSFLQQQAPNGASWSAMCFQLIGGMLLSLIIFLLGVRKYVRD
ncbi:hypothetical protein ACQKFW_00900 [Bacillus subtilis]|uniref:hypothetical protein n=1 Tax=Bacillus subtilis TaxID=1423 RepID=UPI000D4106CF|nr:hypothetical protein [Bacillus subtilis]MXV42555.1 hypothetical protein [Bacillus subtilis]PTU26488.1 hypothetical protein DA469_17140 [Bacillus subtilis]